MFKLNKNTLLSVALVCCLIGFSGCGTMSSNNTANGNAANGNTANGNTAVVTDSANTANTAPVNTTTTPATTQTAAADKIGVPECDEYIEKYEACINSKVPEAQRAMYRSTFDTMRKSWKDAAATPQGKAGLAAGCKQALETARQSMTAFSCVW